MKHFVFCHGFGFDISFWHKLEPYFSGYKVSFLDLGYLGNKTTIDIDKNDTIIAVGHSLGLIKLLDLPKIDYLIGINSFVNFCGIHHELRSARQKELVAFKNNILLNPKLAFKKFYIRCGAYDLYEDMNWDRLNLDLILQDLDLLASCNVSLTHSTLFISTLDDIVVPQSVLRDNFSNIENAHLVNLQSGKHALGYVHPNDVFTHIMDYVDA